MRDYVEVGMNDHAMLLEGLRNGKSGVSLQPLIEKMVKSGDPGLNVYYCSPLGEHKIIVLDKAGESIACFVYLGSTLAMVW